MKNKTVFLNGRFISLPKAKLDVIEPGFLQGWGVFETMRFLKGRIPLLDEHILRLKSACKKIGVLCGFPSGRLKAVLNSLVARNNFNDAYVRLTVWKKSQGVNLLIFAREYVPYSRKTYSEGFKAYISRFRVNGTSLLSGIKTISRIQYELAYKEAETKGFREAIMLSGRGCLSEGSRSNVFFIKNGRLFTPSLDCGCLNGVTRQAVFVLAKKEGIKIKEGHFRVKELLNSDEAFLTNSLMGIMPLSRIGKKKIGKGARFFVVTRLLMEKYDFFIRDGRDKD